MTNLPLCAAIYARTAISDAGIQAQIQTCETFARQRGWTISAVYADPGCLGRHTRHPGICRLTHDALAGRFDIILCEERDRICRNLRAAMKFQAQMAKAGIHFWTVTEGDMTDALPTRKDFMRLLDRLAAADRQGRSHDPQQHA